MSLISVPWKNEERLQSFTKLFYSKHHFTVKPMFNYLVLQLGREIPIIMTQFVFNLNLNAFPQYRKIKSKTITTLRFNLVWPRIFISKRLNPFVLIYHTAKLDKSKQFSLSKFNFLVIRPPPHWNEFPNQQTQLTKFHLTWSTTLISK